MIHVLRPTDLVGLTYFHRRVSGNLARSRDVLALPDHDPGTAALLLADLRWPPRRHSWVARSGRRIQGLASIRRGATRQYWEIDYLVVPNTGSADAVCRDLLTEVSSRAAEMGIEKLHLRVPADHPALSSVTGAGFVWYAEESVLRCDALPHRPAEGGTPALRRRTSADDHALYRLYNQAVPARIRHIEAATFSEWVAVQRLTPAHRSEQWILDGPRFPIAWLRVARRGRSGQLEMWYLAEAEGQLANCVQFGISRLAGQTVGWAVAADYQIRLARLLHEMGFIEVARSAVFARQIAQRVPVARFAPVPV